LSSLHPPPPLQLLHRNRIPVLICCLLCTHLPASQIYFQLDPATTAQLAEEVFASRPSLSLPSPYGQRLCFWAAIDRCFERAKLNCNLIPIHSRTRSKRRHCSPALHSIAFECYYKNQTRVSEHSCAEIERSVPLARETSTFVCDFITAFTATMPRCTACPFFTVGSMLR
jgi:hypothetical protein